MNKNKSFDLPQFLTKDRVLLGLSLLFAFVLWVPQKLTKTFKHQIQLKVSLAPPNDRVIAEDNIRIFPIEIAGKGSQLITIPSRMKTDTLTVPYIGSSFHPQISGRNIVRLLRETYSIDDEIIIDYTVDRLEFLLDSNATIEVPLTLASTPTFSDGFGPVGDVTINPKQVLVSGPHSIVQSFREVQVESELSQLKSSQSALFNLNTSGFPNNVTISIQSAAVTIKVDELVEKELRVTVENFKQGDKSWQLYPNTIFVRLSVPLSLLPTITPNQVKLDMTGQGKHAVSVVVASVPEYTTYINHSPKIIRYFEQPIDSLVNLQ